MNNYETVFIASPVLSDVQIKETVQKFKQLIADAQGTLVHEENWGLRKLAYPIKNRATGFYYLFQYKVNPEFIQKYERAFKYDEQILRFLTVRLEKYSLQYAEKRANLKKEANSTEAEKTETVN
jgi:small subunit ribosomal protein S6